MFAKKTLVAAAALLAAVGAQAQSSVTVYGHLDLSIGSYDNGNDRVVRVESGVEQGSFIGFKGQEDLGGGLKAIFKLESVIAADTGATTGNMWTRTSEVGLAGSFGTVTIGNSLSLNFLANHTYNPFSATGALNVSQAFLGDESFRSNAITYSSPNLSGFTGAVQYAAVENTTGDDTYAAQLNYAAGPLSVGGTYTTIDGYDLWQLGASYNFGVAKVTGQYGQSKEDGDSESLKFFQVGVTVPVSEQGAVLASFGQRKYDGDKVSALVVAYDQSLSKRTGVYAGLVHTKADGEDSTNSFVAGVRHSF